MLECWVAREGLLLLLLVLEGVDFEGNLRGVFRCSVIVRDENAASRSSPPL